VEKKDKEKKRRGNKVGAIKTTGNGGAVQPEPRADLGEKGKKQQG